MEALWRWAGQMATGVVLEACWSCEPSWLKEERASKVQKSNPTTKANISHRVLDSSRLLQVFKCFFNNLFYEPHLKLYTFNPRSPAKGEGSRMKTKYCMKPLVLYSEYIYI